MDGESALQAESVVSAPERRARRAPDAGHRATQRLRSLVLGPPGGGTTRRRASDAVRLGTAVLLVAATIPLIRANTSIELRLAQLLSPPPNGIRWLVSTLWLAGSFGVIALLAVLGLLVPRLLAVRQMAVAGLATLSVCLALAALLGPAGGRSPRCTGSTPATR